MIGKLTGLIARSNQSPVIVDVHSVGYLVHITEKLSNELTAGASSTLFIHTHVRDDALDLYGFAEEKDLSLFELLLTVSGIGPKTALTVIGRGALAVERAVRQSDVDFFTTVPRLGKKNAQKIIIELKNKLGSVTDLDLKGEKDGETKQIMEAMLSMGFGRDEIIQTLENLDASETLEEKIRQSLKLLGKRT